jgi:endonuclease/exonuclease/phosphatase family metal-dependent hydrolase
MRRIVLALFVVTAFCVLVTDAADVLTICSYNIKWLGYSTERDYETLGRVLSNYDVIVIQEIVAPPWPGFYLNGSPYVVDPEVADFFHELQIAYGYECWLSDEDTGSRGAIHGNSSGTEWYAVFYKCDLLERAPGLPAGFLVTGGNPYAVFDRIPYAFPLRHRETGFDFVLVSVHLHEGKGGVDAQRRAAELKAIAAWIDTQDTPETQYLVLGDMNFRDCAEIPASTPASLQYLNPPTDGPCQMTTAVPGDGYPFDNILYTDAVPIDVAFGMRVIDLVSGLTAIWNPLSEPLATAYWDLQYPDLFSDHLPIICRLALPRADAD